MKDVQLDPRGRSGPPISSQKLEGMLKSSKASITLLVGCNTVLCTAPTLAELKQFDKGRNRFVLKKGNGSVKLK